MLELLIAPVASLLDKFIPDVDEKNKLAHEIATLSERYAHELSKEQISVNKTEAAHKSIFVSGWRPAVGWTCCFGLASQYCIIPMSNFGLAVSGVEIVVPSLDLSERMPVLMGMLGLGAMRTYEKTMGVSREK